MPTASGPPEPGKELLVNTTQRFATSWRDVVQAPVGLKGNIRSILRTTTLSTLANFKRPADKGSLRLLYCHYVLDDQIEDFDLIIRTLKGLGTFVTTEECMEMLHGTREIDSTYFHISFDDGFKNICVNASPILKQYDVPSIFFVPSSLVAADFETTKKYCLNTTRYKAIMEMATWPDLNEYVAAGGEIGSHTRTHVRFSEISGSRSRMEDEILGSKRELEDALGYEMQYISWPYGEVKDADEASLNMVKEAGYSACFGAFRGQIIARDTDRFAIPRHHFEAQWPLNHIKFFAHGGLEN
jgi:peptidoglycan/xylan/chitin deacetylase (PgdA/CDA1 family)